MGTLKQDRTEALKEFEDAPDSALFNQENIAFVRDCSTATLERDRWTGNGIPYIKIGRAVKYRKIDVLTWLAQHQPQNSTSEALDMNRNEAARFGSAGYDNKQHNHYISNSVDLIKEFRDFIIVNGETPPAAIVPDGILHRFKDDSGNLNCFYTLHVDGRAAGMIGNWKTGLKVNWKAEGNYPNLNDSQKLEFQIEKHRQEVIRKSEEKARHQDAAAKASYIWNRSKPATTYPYLTKKGIQAHCARLYKGVLVIPIWNKNLLVSLQFIDKSGNKKMLTGGKLKGSSCTIGTYQSGNPVLIAEGFATGASLFESTGYLTVIAFSAGNLKQVAIDTRSLYPNNEIIVCGDNDKSGVGQIAAREAALAIGGKYIKPPIVGNDWNDELSGVNHG